MTGSVEWMPSPVLDADGNLVVVYAEFDPATGALVPGSGGLADGLNSAIVYAAPDLEASNVRTGVSPAYDGANLRAKLEVTNVGLAPSAATTVQFYNGDPGTGGLAIGAPVTVNALRPGMDVTVLSPVFVGQAGQMDIYAVVSPATGEQATANNTAHGAIEVGTPDTTAPTVTVLELAQPDLLNAGDRRLTLQFSSPIATFGRGAVTLFGENCGLIIPDRITYDAKSRRAVLVIEDGLPADTLTLRVNDGVKSAGGVALDGDGDGTPGGEYSISFTLAENAAPTITLDDPAPGASALYGDTYTLTWTDSDPDDDAEIRLYWDVDTDRANNTAGTEGTAWGRIASGISEDDETDSYN